MRISCKMRSSGARPGPDRPRLDLFHFVFDLKRLTKRSSRAFKRLFGAGFPCRNAPTRSLAAPLGPCAQVVHEVTPLGAHVRLQPSGGGAAARGLIPMPWLPVDAAPHPGDALQVTVAAKGPRLLLRPA